jgi:hypothetical protein
MFIGGTWSILRSRKRLSRFPYYVRLTWPSSIPTLIETRRVLSASTQLTTNLVTEYWDPKIIGHSHSAFRWPSRPLAVIGLLYGVASFTTDLVPYLILYGPNDKPSPTPGMQALRFYAVVWRLLLSMVLVMPSMLFFTRLRADLINPQELTIVHYQPRGRTRTSRLIFVHVDWLRILRILLQSLTVGVFSVITVLVMGHAMCNKLQHGDMLRTWVYTTFLDPVHDMGFLRHLGRLSSLLNMLMIAISPWKWVLPYGDGFERWRIFGNE